MWSVQSAFDAISRDDLAHLLLALDGGAPVEAVNPHGFSLLLMAVKKDRPAAVETLLRRGANVNRPGPFGGLPILEAAVQGNALVGRMLLDAGAHLEAMDPHTHATPLLEAARFGNVEFVDLLLSRGAVASHLDVSGYNALSLAQLNDHGPVETLLLQRGFLPQQEFAEDITTMRAAIQASR